jgi:hypothetical protein
MSDVPLETTAPSEDPWDAPIRRWLARQRPSAAGDPARLVTATGVLAEVCGLGPDAQDARGVARVQAALRRAGWTRVRRRCGGVLRRFWMPPASP